MNLKAVCQALENSLIEKHEHNPSKFRDKLTESAVEAARNGALGPLVLFIEWVQCNESAQAALKELGVSWEEA